MVVTAAAFVNDTALFDLGAIKRLSPFSVAAGHLGGLASGVVAVFFVTMIGVNNFFPIAAAAFSLVFISARYIDRKFYRKQLMISIPDSGESFGIVPDLRLIVKNKYLLIFTFVTVCNFLLAGFFEWNLAEQASLEAKNNPEIIAKFLGYVNIGGGIAAIMFQVFFIGGLLSRYGVANTNLGAPVFLLVGAFLVAINPSYIWFAIIARGMFFVAENSFNQTLIRLVYNVVREQDRLRVQGFIESNVITISIALSGMLLLGADFMEMSGFAIAVIAVCIAAVMLWLSWRMISEYAIEARRNYITLSSIGRRELLEDILRGGAGSSNDLINYIRNAADNSSKLQSMDVVVRLGLEDRYQDFVFARLSTDNDQKVRIAALKGIGLLNRDRDLELVRRYNSDEDPIIALQANDIGHDISGQNIDASSLDRFFNFNDSDVASTAFVQLMHRSGLDAIKDGAERLDKYKRAKSEHKRLTYIKTLGKIGTSTIDDLVALIPKANAIEKIEIVRSLGTVSHRRVYPYLLEALNDAETRLTARQALLSHPEIYCDLIIDQLEGDTKAISQSVVVSLIWVLGRIKTTGINEDSVDRIVDRIQSSLLKLMSDDSILIQLEAAHALSNAVSEKTIPPVELSFVATHLKRFEGISAANASIQEYLLSQEFSSVTKFGLTLYALKDLISAVQTAAYYIVEAAFPEESLSDVRKTLMDEVTREEGIEVLENIMPRKIFHSFSAVFLVDTEASAIDNDFQLKNIGFAETWHHLATSGEDSHLMCLYYNLTQSGSHSSSLETLSNIDDFKRIAGLAEGTNMASTLEKAQILIKSPVFADTSVGDLIEIAEKATELQYDSGKEIYSPEVASDYIFVVTGGDVGLFRRGAGDIDQKIDTVTENGILGAINILSGKNYSESARAESAVTCLALSRTDLRQIFSQRPEMMDNLVDILHDQINQLHLRLLEQANIGERIGEQLNTILATSLANLELIPEIKDSLKKVSDRPVVINLGKEIEDALSSTNSNKRQPVQK